jgi:hypothetical protein
MTSEEALPWLRVNGVIPRRQGLQVLFDYVPVGVYIPGGLVDALRDVPDDLLAAAMRQGEGPTSAHAISGGMTLSTLMQKEFIPRREFVPGIIVQGVTLLAAKAKIGKTWLVLGTGLALALGGKAWSRARSTSVIMNVTAMWQ